MTAGPLVILLDLDGTVVDSEPGILASSKAALHALGHPTDDLDIGDLIGPPLEEVLRTVLERFGDDRVAEAVLAYREHYGSAGLVQTTVYPGMEAALGCLSALGARLCIATSKRTIFAERILGHLGLRAAFSGVHGSEPGGAVDRKGDLIAEILKQNALEDDMCLMVGDRREDVLGARANGIATIGVLWGYGNREELKAAGAEHIVARPEDLVAVVETLIAERADRRIAE